jgi:predicted phosphodiesterase
VKTIFIGDVHGRATWKLMVHQENPDRVIFIGDYFDSFDIPGVDQIHNFKEIIEYKKTSGKEVILLIGNHDHHYLPEVGYTGTSGYQRNLAPSIIQVVDENREHLQMAYQFENILCTHAGVSHLFLDNTFGPLFYSSWSVDTLAADLNELFTYKPKLFCFTPTRFGDQGGDS